MGWSTIYANRVTPTPSAHEQNDHLARIGSQAPGHFGDEKAVSPLGAGSASSAVPVVGRDRRTVCDRVRGRVRADSLRAGGAEPSPLARNDVLLRAGQRSRRCTACPPHFVASHQWQGTVQWVARFGFLALATVAALPITHTPALIFCALLGMPPLEVFASFLIGKGIKYAVCAAFTVAALNHATELRTEGAAATAPGKEKKLQNDDAALNSSKS
jgi:hypothetical protein